MADRPVVPIVHMAELVVKAPARDARGQPENVDGRDSEYLLHAIETFGSETAAEKWMDMTCGALQNRTPRELVRAGKANEVDRILHCIDHGMIA